MAISSPVCALERILLLSPYLEVNLPETGCAKLTPKLGAALDIFVDVLIFSLLLVVTVDATAVDFLPQFLYTNLLQPVLK